MIHLKGHQLSWLADGMIKPDPKATDAERLLHIETEMTQLIQAYQPDTAAIEEIFVAKNPSSSLKLGMARGAAIVAVARNQIPLSEIAARRVKQNITGSGRADKSQVTAMVSRLLNITPSGFDAADALAIAIAAMNEQYDPINNKAYNNPAINNLAEEQTSTQNIPSQRTGLEAAIQKALEKEGQS